MCINSLLSVFRNKYFWNILAIHSIKKYIDYIKQYITVKVLVNKYSTNTKKSVNLLYRKKTSVFERQNIFIIKLDRFNNNKKDFYE